MDRYCRLFCPVEPAFDPCVMTSLGLSMKSEMTGGSNLPSLPTTLPVGFTYFGQFIDHDLTRDDTALQDAGKLSPVETLNHGGGLLDLSHIYGDGPGSDAHGHLYGPDGASFLLDDARINGEQFDLRLKGDKPQTADDRNIENIFLRQLCVVFMKLHNLAVSHPLAGDQGKDPFEVARNRVRWQYQWIVRHEYLAAVCSYSVYRDLFGDQGYEAKPQKIDWCSDGFAIPVEFSHAAFRFGHSLVRPSYIINSQSGKVPLEEILGNPEGSISADRLADWCSFLQHGGKEGPELAMAFDTRIARPLFHLPADHFHHLITGYSPDLPPELPVRTLRRGAAIGLASGEEVASKLGRVPLRQTKPEGYKTDPWANLDELGLAERTPLWYYVLLEAELEQRGLKLGTVGSRLVAETIEGSLRADRDSFLSRHGPGWVPPTWTDFKGDQAEIRRLVDVTTTVGLASCPS